MKNNILAIMTAACCLLLPVQALACACGCSIFDVGAGALLPNGPGGVAYVEYDFMDQNRNWSGTSGAPASANSDKQIRSNFVTLGAQYMLNHAWGVMVEVPVWDRLFRTDDGGGVEAHQHAALGDIRLKGVYSGFSADMSTGVIFGVKLPTGDYKYAGFDRDTALGTGSLDLLLGGYHTGHLTHDGLWSYFAQAMVQIPVTSTGGYRPGRDLNAAVGVRYHGATFAGGRMRLTPLLQVIASARGHDAGVRADPPNSGYSRLLISPGLALDVDAWRLYGDVELPVYQQVRGDQLVAPALFKMVLSRSF